MKLTITKKFNEWFWDEPEPGNADGFEFLIFVQLFSLFVGAVSTLALGILGMQFFDFTGFLPGLCIAIAPATIVWLIPTMACMLVDGIVGAWDLIKHGVRSLRSLWRWTKASNALFKGKVIQGRIEPHLWKPNRPSVDLVVGEFVRDQLRRTLKTDVESVRLLRQQNGGGLINVLFVVSRSESRTTDTCVSRDTSLHKFFFLQAVEIEGLRETKILNVEMIPGSRFGDFSEREVDREWAILTDITGFKPELYDIPRSVTIKGMIKGETTLPVVEDRSMVTQ